MRRCPSRSILTNWRSRSDVARFKDGFRVYTRIFEAAAYHQAVKPVCKCGHSATFNPHGLWWRFHRKGWDDGLSAACVRFWCRPCATRLGRRVRPIRLDLVPETAADVLMPMPDEHEWKRALSRYR